MPPSRPNLSILVPDGESHFALPVVTCLGSEPNVDVHVISSHRDARVRRSRYCDSFEALSETGDDARLACVKRAVELHGVNVILPACETGVRLLQRHREELLGLAHLPPFPDPETLDIASDKWRLAEFLSRHGIPHPSTALYSADHQFEAEIDALEFPVLTKPRRGSGGRDIRRFSDCASLLAYLEAHPETRGEHLVQSFIPGRDVDYSLFARRGRVLAHTIQAPLETRHGYAPADAIELFDHPEAAAVAQRLVAALGWDGIAHIDLRENRDTGEIRVLEINPRFWSSLLASHAAGVNFPRLASLTALGLVYAAPRARAQRFVQAKRAMIMTARGLMSGAGPAGLALRETIWPYLVADPLPHCFGRMALDAGREPEAVRDERRTAKAA
jgi:glutathione synthase/RimK-type ligase-like ATP-grasp enzyme